VSDAPSDDNSTARSASTPLGQVANQVSPSVVVTGTILHPLKNTSLFDNQKFIVYLYSKKLLFLGVVHYPAEDFF
jgi:hypothetical protein